MVNIMRHDFREAIESIPDYRFSLRKFENMLLLD